MGKLSSWNPGSSLKNFESCEFPARVSVVVETAAPLRLINSRRTVALADDVFVIAIPDWIASEASTYVRNAVPAGVAGTPASVIRIPELLNEKTSEPAGAALLADGTTRTEPIRTATPEPAVAICFAAWPGIE